MMETRTVELTEIRADKDSPRTLRGRAVTYGREADLGQFIERIEPGALATPLQQEANIVALYEHDRRAMLGSTRNQTLRLTDGAEGLDFELDVAKTTAGDDVLALVNSGEIRGMSFGFKVAERGQRWSRRSERVIRTITKIERFPEITVTVAPAYDTTSISSRSIDPEAMEEAKRQAAKPTLAARRLMIRKLLLDV